MANKRAGGEHTADENRSTPPLMMPMKKKKAFSVASSPRAAAQGMEFCWP